MDGPDRLAQRFEDHRSHLRAVAYRMLGSLSEADDAVQETWLRFSRTDPGPLENLTGWLTTVTARVCLNQLQSRRTRREEPLDTPLFEPAVGREDWADPEHQALLADSVGRALLVVLDTLTPAERVAFVLHDMFAVPFEEIAPIVGRSVAATRQLASRGRRRIPGSAGSLMDTHTDGAAARTDPARHREAVDAFLAASRKGDFDALLAVLDPDVVLRGDPAAVALAVANLDRGAVPLSPTPRGAAAIATLSARRYGYGRRALVNGALGTVWIQGGRPRVVFTFRVTDGKVAEIRMTADPERIGRWDLTLLDR